MEKECTIVKSEDGKYTAGNYDITKSVKLIKKEIFDRFDEYACIKNDKWYLELRAKEIGENNE